MSGVALRVGFVPLTDCAPLVIAQEMGFAAEEGIALVLQAAPSWSTLRDRLIHGACDAAHMLSPVPVAMAMGLGPWSEGLEALQVTSVNGNVVGLSRDLAAKLDGPAFGDAAAWRDALTRAAPLRVAVPFAYSMHRELLHRWLGDVDMAVRTVPPSMMADALAAGEVDLFCVGEPWGSAAVEAGVAHLILPGAAIWAWAPEKVLAARAGWAASEPLAARALMRATWRAGRWLADPDRRATAAGILARPEYLDRPVDLLERALAGRFVVSPQGALAQVPGHLHFHDGAAAFPWRSQGAWIADRLAVRFGRDRAEARKQGAAVFRSDLFRENLSGIGAAIPAASARIEGALDQPTAVPAAEGRLILSPDAFFDGIPFDPDG